MKFALGLLVLLLATPVQAQVSDAYLVTPGKGIGTIMLGESFADVQTRLGPATSVRTDSTGHTVYSWLSGTGTPDTAGGIAVAVARSLITAVIAYRDSRYATSTGIRSGLRERDVMDRLGQPRSIGRLPDGAQSLRYPGLNVIVDKGGTVYELSVVAL